MNAGKPETAESLLERAKITLEWKNEVDVKYGCSDKGDAVMPTLPETIDGIEDIKYMESYFKTMYLLQKKSIRQFSEIVTTALRNPVQQDELVERFGGDTTIKDIYFDGCNELNDVAKEYKALMKAAKILRK